jgi:hypothetical protein
MMDSTVRHLRRHWRLNLAVLLCLTLSSAFLAGFATYTGAIETRELRQTLAEAHPAGRTLLITGPRTAFGEALYDLLQERLGNVEEQRLVIRHAVSPADLQPTEGSSQKRTVALLDLYSFDHLAERVRVVDGRLPAQVRLQEAEDIWRPPPIEAIIGRTAAQQSGYGIGDRLSGSGTYHRLEIVGIVEPLEPHADIWGGDFSAFALMTDTRELDAEAIALPLIIAEASMRSNYPEQPIFLHSVSWRVALDRGRISAHGAEALRADLINLQTQFATQNAAISTDLIQILTDTLARLSRVRASFLLLTAQTLLFVLYTLTVFTSFVVERSQVELTLLTARGVSTWQITRLFAAQNLILALAAGLLLGPALAQVAIHVWSRSASGFVPSALSGGAWLLSGMAAGFGWLALVLPVFLSVRRNVRCQQPMRSRSPQASPIGRRYLDLYLLAFAGLLYWQLNQSGSFLMRQLGDTQAVDPILLLGPTLLLVAVVLVFLRVLPFLLRLVAWPSQRLRGWALSLGLLHLARDPLRASRLVLLVSLTAGLALFSRTFGDSLAHGPEALRSDALAQGVGAALQLNTLTLLLFSVTAFFLANLLAVQGRRGEFGILRPLGLSVRQWLAVLALEGAVILGLGLLAGTLVGWGLSHIMIPYLSQSLVGSSADVAIERLVVDWTAVAWLYALLLAVYGAALAMVWLIQLRSQAQLAQWIGDE